MGYISFIKRIISTTNTLYLKIFLVLLQLINMFPKKNIFLIKSENKTIQIIGIKLKLTRHFV